jgi:Fe-S-cluster containining protein
MSMSEKQSVPVQYECQGCGACCRWAGDVCVEEDEVDKIAAFLGMDSGIFIDQFCRLRANRQGLSLIDAPDGACIMLENNRCRINPVKPEQCRQFPNGWNFPGWRDLCKAKPVPVTGGKEQG